MRRQTRGQSDDVGPVEEEDAMFAAVMAMRQAVTVAVQHGDIKLEAVRS